MESPDSNSKRKHTDSESQPAKKLKQNPDNQITDHLYPSDADSYQLCEIIGCGFKGSRVFKGICTRKEDMVAVKTRSLVPPFMDSNPCCVNVIPPPPPHPNILQPHSSFLHPPTQQRWVVMPFISGGSAQSLMASHYNLGLPHKFLPKILKQVLSALAHLHAHGHVHGNIKPTNILVDEGSVKLTDVGVTVSSYNEHSPSPAFRYWVAPELETKTTYPYTGYDKRSDIWSFGVTALELASGKPPVSQLPPLTHMVLQRKIRERFCFFDTNDLSEGSKDFPETFKNLVGRCLVKDPSQRPTAEELLKHDYFKGADDVSMKELLEGVTPIEERLKRDFVIDIVYWADGNWVVGWIFDEVGCEFHPIFMDRVRFANMQNARDGDDGDGEGSIDDDDEDDDEASDDDEEDDE